MVTVPSPTTRPRTSAASCSTVATKRGILSSLKGADEDRGGCGPGRTRRRVRLPLGRGPPARPATAGQALAADRKRSGRCPQAESRLRPLSAVGRRRVQSRPDPNGSGGPTPHSTTESSRTRASRSGRIAIPAGRPGRRDRAAGRSSPHARGPRTSFSGSSPTQTHSIRASRPIRPAGRQVEAQGWGLRNATSDEITSQIFPATGQCRQAARRRARSRPSKFDAITNRTPARVGGTPGSRGRRRRRSRQDDGRPK